jgi:hypothetical protein
VLHHVSFNAREPAIAANALAQMLGARALRAPQPPFPAGSWFVVYGDAQGSLLEVLPWGKALDPEASGGMRDDPAMRQYHGTHVLLQTSRTPEDILSIAKAHGWRALPASAGLFSFTKVWIEGTFLVEIMTPEQARDYVKTFNHEGLTTLDAKLRGIEAALARPT